MILDFGCQIMKHFLAICTLLLMLPALAFAEENNFDERMANTWEIAVGYMYLQRDSGDNKVLMQDAGNPARNLTTDHFGDLGANALVASLSGDVFDTGFEIRGILSDTASEPANAITGAPTLVRINTFVPFFIPGVTSVTGTRETTFDSIEGNIDLFSGDNWRFFGGGRALWIDDELNLALNAAVIPSTLLHQVTNRLAGPQIGVEIEQQDFLIPNVRLSASARAAYVQSDTSFNNVLNTGVVIVSATGKDTNWTPMYELAANATINVTPMFDIELGYNFIYIDDLASAPSSFCGVNYFTGTIGAPGPAPQCFGGPNESVSYHGATLKAIWRLN